MTLSPHHETALTTAVATKVVTPRSLVGAGIRLASLAIEGSWPKDRHGAASLRYEPAVTKERP